MKIERLVSMLTNKAQEIENTQALLEKNIDTAQKLADQILQQQKTETKQLLTIGFLGLCGLAAAALVSSFFASNDHNLKR
jgi:hypothetical protein